VCATEGCLRVVNPPSPDHVSAVRNWNSAPVAASRRQLRHRAPLAFLDPDLTLATRALSGRSSRTSGPGPESASAHPTIAEMLRVIAGSAGGRRLVAPKGAARPTTDRLKEALFASLGPHRTDGAAVLDLYAGSGALAIEALSRGAARAVLVDRDFAAEVAIRANLATTGFADVATVVRSPVTSYFRTEPPAGPFDVVFLDPPYDVASAEVGEALLALARPGWLAEGATVVVERPKAGDAVELPDGWGIEKERAYGDTLLVVAIA
jgi:16S rRNA (guanine966-N2)-methyltransferase